MEKNDYRPANIMFEVDSSEVPEILGVFENEKEMAKFIGDNLTFMPMALTATRFMDDFEKKEIRKEYNDLLENKLPFAERELQAAEYELKKAKDFVSQLKDQVNGTIEEIKSLAVSVKRGTQPMNLDSKYTIRVPYNDQYFFYTWMNQKLQLCKIKDIPDQEKSDLFNQMSKNAEFIKKAMAEEVIEDE